VRELYCGETDFFVAQVTSSIANTAGSWQLAENAQSSMVVQSLNKLPTSDLNMIFVLLLLLLLLLLLTQAWFFNALALLPANLSSQCKRSARVPGASEAHFVRGAFR
jgi:hypothetical protein